MRSPLLLASLLIACGTKDDPAAERDCDSVEIPYDGIDNDCGGGDALDLDGDGTMDVRRDRPQDLSIPQWVLFSW